MTTRVSTNNVLYHHGIKGQKWGVRRFQNQDGSYTPQGQSENNGHGRYSDVESDSIKIKTSAQKEKNEDKKLASRIKKRYALSDEQYDQYKKTAKIIGVSLAATAGVLAVAYAINKNPNITKAIRETNLQSLFSRKESIEVGKEFASVHMTDQYDAATSYGPSFTHFVDEINDTLNVGDPVGERAEMHGYGVVTNGYDLIHSAMKVERPNSLPFECIVNQREANWFGPMDRRLSCWSGSHSYLLSRMTGNQYCSRNYQNLVEFNSFGQLYSTKQNIVDLFGHKAKDFVGEFGKENGSKIKGVADAKHLIDNIYKNFTKTNTVDGGVVGFIDAAYRGTTCTHQWNFEIDKQGILSMIDTWSGEKYAIASKNARGRIKYNLETILKDKGDGTSFLSELYHYNRESFRMYSPSLNDLDLDKIAEIVLAKIRD